MRKIHIALLLLLSIASVLLIVAIPIAFANFNSTRSTVSKGSPVSTLSGTPTATSQTAHHTPESTPPVASAQSALHIQGNTLVNSNGVVVQLQGVVLSQIEFTCQSTSQEYLASSYAAMRNWHVNAVKIPVNPKYWDGEQCNAAAYQKSVYTAVDTAIQQGMYVLFTMIAFNHGTSGDPAPLQSSLTTLSDLAAHYANSPAILFEPYSEPHLISWAVWRNGDPALGYIGMQTLVNAIHAADPQALIFANGIDYGGRTGEVLANGGPLSGAFVGYSVHLYDNGHNADSANWPQDFATLAQSYPVIAGEFGSNTGACGATFLQQLLPFMKKNMAGWFAWEWNPDSSQYCKRPALLIDAVQSLTTGAPSPYGQVIFQFYRQDGILPARP